MTEALMLEVAVLGGRLGPSASWGSWCSLGQTHETSHVDGAGTKAKLCIYLKVWLADFHLSFSLAGTLEAPSGGSRWTGMTAPGVPIAIGAAEGSMMMLEALECAFH
jgi:hypothetical protein